MNFRKKEKKKKIGLHCLRRGSANVNYYNHLLRVKIRVQMYTQPASTKERLMNDRENQVTFSFCLSVCFYSQLRLYRVYSNQFRTTKEIY